MCENVNMFKHGFVYTQIPEIYIRSLRIVLDFWGISSWASKQAGHPGFKSDLGQNSSLLSTALKKTERCPIGQPAKITPHTA